MAEDLPPPIPPAPNLPPMFTMARNLVESAKDIIKTAVDAGALIAPEDKIAERWKICETCEFFVVHPVNGLIPYRCSICGCAMKTKVLFLGARCPKGKW